MASLASITANVPTTPDPNAKNDARAQSIQGAINDWSTCPTTDPGTKKQIVDKLASELASVYKEVSSHDSMAAKGSGSSYSPQGKAIPSQASTLDLRA